MKIMKKLFSRKVWRYSSVKEHRYFGSKVKISRGNRDGKRKSREQRAKYKVPELGYYLIVTDTEATERCFLQVYMIVLMKR